jgi:hypothetical protein
VQPGDTLQAFGQPLASQPAPAVVDEFDVVVVLRPIVAQIQHRVPPSWTVGVHGSVEETSAI